MLLVWKVFIIMDLVYPPDEVYHESIIRPNVDGHGSKKPPPYDNQMMQFSYVKISAL
jgi:hypothetical protein